MTKGGVLKEWRAAITSEQGPQDYTMRLLLLALSVLMERAGCSTIRVTRKQLAVAAGLSDRWVATIALRAMRQGWLSRRHPRGFGSAWQAYEYAPSIPEGCDLPEQVSRGTEGAA